MRLSIGFYLLKILICFKAFLHVGSIYRPLNKIKQLYKIYTTIGNYWERGNQNEIDIVAVDEIDKKILLCEVKLSAKRLNYNELVKKSVNILKKYKGYEVEYRLLSVEDIDLF